MWLDRFLPPHANKQTDGKSPLFQERATRFYLDLPVSFVAQGKTYTGQSLNMSDSGLLARFEQLPNLSTDGQLFLEAGEHYLDINVRVTRLRGNDVAFAFAIVTVNDRTAISVLVSFASDRPFPSRDSSALI